MVIIGNWLLTDGLMARLKNTGFFTVVEFPLLREGEGTAAEQCTWKGSVAKLCSLPHRTYDGGSWRRGAPQWSISKPVILHGRSSSGVCVGTWRIRSATASSRR